MKLLVDINEIDYKHILDSVGRGVLFLDLTSIMKNCIIKGTAIRDDATGGDVMKMMFPGLDYKEDRGIISVMSPGINWKFMEEWWNMPYKEIINNQIVNKAPMIKAKDGARYNTPFSVEEIKDDAALSDASYYKRMVDEIMNLQKSEDKIGHWIFKDADDEACLIYTCDKCGEQITIYDDTIKSP